MLTDSGLVVSPNMVEDKYEPRSALASMLRWHADHWDLLRSFLRRRTTRVQPGNLPKVWEAYVRLAVVDLALRVAAHLHLAGSLPEALDFSRVCQPPGPGELSQPNAPRGRTLPGGTRRTGRRGRPYCGQLDVPRHTAIQ